MSGEILGKFDEFLQKNGILRQFLRKNLLENNEIFPVP